MGTAIPAVSEGLTEDSRCILNASTNSGIFSNINSEGITKNSCGIFNASTSSGIFINVSSGNRRCIFNARTSSGIFINIFSIATAAKLHHHRHIINASSHSGTTVRTKSSANASNHAGASRDALAKES
jgi:hypothetical protein